MLLGLLVPGVRNLVSIPAGTLHMPMARSPVLTTLGSLGWNASLIWLGSALASRWEAVSGVLSTASTYGLVAVGAAATAYVATRYVATRGARTLPSRG